MSCRECKEQPLRTAIRWKHATIGLEGCKEHLTEVARALSAVQQMVALQFDAQEIDTLLTQMDWTHALPEEYQVPFLKIVSQFGALAGIHRQLVEAGGGRASQEGENTDDDDGTV